MNNSTQKKALMLASVASMIDQFNMPNIELLLSLGYEVDVVADFYNPGNITLERAEKLKTRLNDMGVRVIHIAIPRTLNPKSIISAYKAVKNLIRSEDYNLMHCHSPIGSAIARIAAKVSRKLGMRIIYTAHGFHFYNGAPAINWLIYYPIEKFLSRNTDILITINQEDFQRATEKFHAKQTLYIPGVGVDTEKFSSCRTEISSKRKSIGVPTDAFMLMSVGELNDNKNHAVVIKAMGQLKNESVHYVVVGKGDNFESLIDLADSFGIGSQVHLLGYRNDVPELYYAADVCVFPSIREGLGIAAIEGMAAGLPCLVAENRGTRDLFSSENAIICRFDDVRTFSEGILTLMQDETMRHNMGERNRIKSREFDISVIQRTMKEVYQNVTKQ